MKWLTFNIQKTPGFRLNLIDLAFILLLCGIGVMLHMADVPMMITALPLYLGFSFFLFCNVFRIGNYLERFWYLPFTFITVLGLRYREYEIMWWSILLVLEPLKWLLVIRTIKSPNYVGAGYRLWGKSSTVRTEQG